MKLSLVESGLFGRVCYEYRRDKKGLVGIVLEETAVVRAVFGLYKTGNSLEEIPQKFKFNIYTSNVRRTKHETGNKIVHMARGHLGDGSGSLFLFGS